MISDSSSGEMGKRRKSIITR